MTNSVNQPATLSPADYRINAEKCRQLAHLSSDARRREQCLSLAASWEDLAGWREFNAAKSQQIAAMVERLLPEGSKEGDQA